jgi:acyl dehydratase
MTAETAPRLFHIDEAVNYVGRAIGVSPWVTIDQAMVDGFANSTHDPDWMHVDVERSRRESPYRGTIVQGFLMLSLLIDLSHQIGLVPKGTSYALNYGLDRVRFTSVVLTGARVRTHATLAAVEPRGEGRTLFKAHHRMEVEGQEKPSMVADWLTLWFHA